MFRTSKSIMEIIGLILARGGSRGVPNKHIRILGDKPLIRHIIDVAKQSNLKHIFVSSDSQEILDLCGDIQTILRPVKLATDTATSVQAARHAVEEIEKRNFKFDTLLLMNACCPFMTTDDINDIIDRYEEFTEAGCDSATSVVQDSRIHPSKCKIIIQDQLIDYVPQFPEKVFERQLMTKVYRRNCALYLVRKDILMRRNSFFGDWIYPHVMPEERSWDINSEFDFRIAESLMKNQ